MFESYRDWYWWNSNRNGPVRKVMGIIKIERKGNLWWAFSWRKIDDTSRFLKVYKSFNSYHEKYIRIKTWVKKIETNNDLRISSILNDPSMKRK